MTEPQLADKIITFVTSYLFSGNQYALVQHQKSKIFQTCIQMESIQEINLKENLQRAHSYRKHKHHSM